MPSEMKTKRVVYEIPGMREAVVQKGIEYKATGSGQLTMDLYHPKHHKSGEARLPAVVIALGYPDAGGRTPFGCQFREMGMIVSWAELFAASGMVGVVYETANPAEDVHAVLSILRTNGAAWGIDGARIGLWACSGNTPVALSALMAGGVRCGVLCYGFLLDLGEATGVANAAREYRFANPTAGRLVEDLPADTTLFIARAGGEQFAGLNDAMDSFVAAALKCNLPVTLMNHTRGPHGFDYADDSDASRQAIRAILLFLQGNLGLVERQ